MASEMIFCSFRAREMKFQVGKLIFWIMQPGKMSPYFSHFILWLFPSCHIRSAPSFQQLNFSGLNFCRPPIIKTQKGFIVQILPTTCLHYPIDESFILLHCMCVCVCLCVWPTCIPLCLKQCSYCSAGIVQPELEVAMVIWPYRRTSRLHLAQLFSGGMRTVVFC